MEFYFQSNSGKNYLKFLKSNSLSLCLTELFSIKINIGPTDGVMIVPSTHHPNVCIILQIFRFIVQNYRKSLQTELTGKSLYFYSKKPREGTCHKRLNMLVCCECHMYSFGIVYTYLVIFFFFSCSFLFDHVIRDKHICLCCIKKG